MKGTIESQISRCNQSVILIPVPTKGTINRSLIIGIRQECFNPRTYEGYDMKAEERPYLICTLIPVPMKGTIPERLVSGFKVDSL